ncbi:hypothetical protein CHLRE_15g643850v5 [Chlamydomonas reinhardtii]|uniref:Uncharacterized protein n=1 Tax=Chlamydomonas reinhardtii TaxID=3055 RepID=A0A2K3CWY1_CHLRE|nr:uncharacterized protein CHLRE_15g643850v5 [Chlamydomonas reinhardtii]PNW72793.1 hypothetical protein CHLRE_15g643850v5 [Chlamydomonas reinhardtii]
MTRGGGERSPPAWDAAADNEPKKKKQKVKVTKEGKRQLLLEEAKMVAPDAIVKDGRFLPLWIKTKVLTKVCWLSQSYALICGSAGIKWSDFSHAFREKGSKGAGRYDVYALLRGWLNAVIMEATDNKDLGLEFIHMDPNEPVASAVWAKLESMVETYTTNYQAESVWGGDYKLAAFVAPKEKQEGMTEAEKRQVMKDNANALHVRWWAYVQSKNPPLLARMYNFDNDPAPGTTPAPRLGGAPTPVTGAQEQRQGQEPVGPATAAGGNLTAPAAGAAAAVTGAEAAVTGAAAAVTGAAAAATGAAAAVTGAEAAVTGAAAAVTGAAAAATGAEAAVTGAEAAGQTGNEEAAGRRQGARRRLPAVRRT